MRSLSRQAHLKRRVKQLFDNRNQSSATQLIKVKAKTQKRIVGIKKPISSTITAVLEGKKQAHK